MCAPFFLSSPYPLLTNRQLSHDSHVLAENAQALHLLLFPQGHKRLPILEVPYIDPQVLLAQHLEAQVGIDVLAGGDNVPIPEQGHCPEPADEHVAMEMEDHVSQAENDHLPKPFEDQSAPADN